MTYEQVSALRHGLYKVYWKSGGYSLASVGSDAAGHRWFAPSNWISGPSKDWHPVKKVIRITQSRY